MSVLSKKIAKIILAILIPIITGIVLLRIYPVFSDEILKLFKENKQFMLAKNELFLGNSTGYKLIIPDKLFEIPGISFKIESGYKLVQESKNKRIVIMELTKLSAYKIKEAIRLMASKKSELPKECSVIQVDENRWIIDSLDSELITCGSYSNSYENKKTRRYFTLIHGFIAFVNVPEEYRSYFEKLENTQLKENSFKIEAVQ